MLGKLSSSDNSVLTDLLSTTVDDPIVYGFRMLCLIGMLLTNAMMLNCFVKSLNQLNTLTATINSAAMNFICTAVFGRFCFHEELPGLWWIGAGIILLGMRLIISAESAQQQEKRD